MIERIAKEYEIRSSFVVEDVDNPDRIGFVVISTCRKRENFPLLKIVKTRIFVSNLNEFQAKLSRLSNDIRFVIELN